MVDGAHWVTEAEKKAIGPLKKKNSRRNRLRRPFAFSFFAAVGVQMRAVLLDRGPGREGGDARHGACRKKRRKKKYDFADG